MMKSFFQDDNAFCHRAQEINAFLQAYKINDMASEQFESKSIWKFIVEIFLNGPWEGSITKEDLSTAIREVGTTLIKNIA